MSKKDADPSPVVPLAQKIPYKRVFHGDTFVDYYQWLHDKDSPETRAFIDSENAYTEHRLESLKGLRKTLFDELKSRVKQTDMSVPTRVENYWYYARTLEGKQYGIQCRAPIAAADDWDPPVVDERSPLPGEQTVFDGNIEAEKFKRAGRTRGTIFQGFLQR